MNTPYLRVLGSCSTRQSKNNDFACYTLSDKLLIDANTGIIQHLFDAGINPASIRTVLFTHLHPDHAMGLLPFIFQFHIQTGDLSHLTIAGPKDSIFRYVDLAMDYLYGELRGTEYEYKVWPKIIPLSPGDEIETEDFRILACEAQHAVPALSYRITDKQSGKVAVFSGDTRYFEGYSKPFANADILVHEVSLQLEHAENLPGNTRYRHSSIHDAVKVATEAQVKRLFFTHNTPEWREKCVTAAQDMTSIPVQWAEEGQVFPY